MKIEYWNIIKIKNSKKLLALAEASWNRSSVGLSWVWLSVPIHKINGAHTPPQGKWPSALKDSRLCGLTQGGGSEERSGLLFQTTFLAALSLRASASRFLPPVLRPTSSYAKDIHGYCSSSLAMSRYPTNWWFCFENHQKPNLTKKRDK